MDFVLLNMISGRTILCQANMADLLAGKPTPMSRPMNVQPVMQPGGQVAMQLIPYMVTEPADSKIEPVVYPHSIETYGVMPEVLKSHYTQATSSIALPPTARGGLSLVQ